MKKALLLIPLLIAGCSTMNTQQQQQKSKQEIYYHVSYVYGASTNGLRPGFSILVFDKPLTNLSFYERLFQFVKTNYDTNTDSLVILNINRL